MADLKTEPEVTTGLETVTVPAVSEPTTQTPDAEGVAPVGAAPTPVEASSTPVGATMTASDTVAAPASVIAAPVTAAAPALAAASPELAADSVAVAADSPATATTDHAPAVDATPAAVPAITVKDVDAASQAGPQHVFTAPDASPASPDASPAAPTTSEHTPLDLLWQLAKEHAHPEVWGVTLADPATHVPSQVVFQKYLNANDGDLTKAKDQLAKTLDWRAKMKPLELIEKVYPKTKFEGLGFVTTYNSGDAREVFTWNIYGGVKSIDETFGDLDEFISWRVALMELALQRLDLASATVPITVTSDPYKMYQVHDYRSISFLRQSAAVKSASAETIKVFAQNYPELLKEKFFVNVPAIMGFVYNFMKLFVAPKTIKKFHPMSNGGGLAAEFGDSEIKGLGEMLPGVYGGKGEELAVQGTGPVLA